MPDAAPVVAIDGPSGSGKGTVAHRVAGRLGFHLLDSGSLYRVLALAARGAGVDLGDGPALAALAAGLDLEFRTADAGSDPPVRPILAGADVADAIRSEDCGRDASRVAALAEVRAALLARQRAFRRAPGLVADGRDMGTVVFPDAQAKIFLTASPEARAERRHKQLIDKGIGVNLADLLGEITERDARDRDRTVSPLRPADDAVVIDTTGLDVESVVRRAIEAIARCGLARG